MEKMEIIRMAFDLGNMIAQSKELIDLEEKKANVIKDAEAYKLVIDFQEMRQKIMEKLQAGQELTESDREEMSRFENAINENPLVKSLYDSQEKFDNLLNSVYFAINDALNHGSTCESGCEGCGGSCGL